MDKQESFDFPVDPPVGRPTEPLPKVKVTRQSTSICAYCGQRMPAGLLEGHWPADDNRWTMTAPYHAPQCKWIVSRGLRGTEPDRMSGSAQSGDASKQPPL